MAAPPLITVAGKIVPAHYFGSHFLVDQLGTGAPRWTWALPPATAAEVLSKPEVKVEVSVPGGKKESWDRIVVVKEAPSSDPLARNVVLSDTRVYLPRVNVRKIYNQRTKSGVTKLLRQINGNSQTVQLAPNLVYALPSLKPDGVTAWRADEILRDMAGLITQLTKIPVRILARSRGDFIPNDILLSGPLNVVLGHVMGQVGGLDCRVAKDGAIEIVDASMGSERDTISLAVTYSLLDMGTLRFVDMSHLAPKQINIQYIREMELRCDAWEQSPIGSQSYLNPGSDPILENVAVVTDVSLAGTDSRTKKQTVWPRGTAVLIDDYFSAVTALNDGPTWAKLPFNRQAFLDHYYSNLMHRNFVEDPDDHLAPSILWDTRIGSVKHCLRRLYRLNPDIVARIVPGSIKAVTADILDPTTGERQESQVWQDYTQRYLERGQKLQSRHGGNYHFIPPDDGQFLTKGTYVKSYGPEQFPSNPVALSLCRPAPIRVKVVDAYAGLVDLESRSDPNFDVAETIPSLTVGMPISDCFKIVASGGNPYWFRAGLSYTHRVATILSVVPYGPNNSAQLHVYAVTPSEALKRLGAPAKSVRPQGPPLDVAIPATPSLTARIAWDDTKRSLLLQCIKAPVAAVGIEKLVPVNDLDLKDYAVAQAATVMAAFLDHWEGEASIGFSPGVRPSGSLMRVVHAFTSSGEIFTTLECRMPQVPFQPEHFLRAQTRQNLFQNLGGG